MQDQDLNPFRQFDRASWAALRQDQALELSSDELDGLRSLGDPISLDEVRAIYLPVIRLLELYIEASAELCCGGQIHDSAFVANTAGAAQAGGFDHDGWVFEAKCAA